MVPVPTSAASTPWRPSHAGPGDAPQKGEAGAVRADCLRETAQPRAFAPSRPLSLSPCLPPRLRVHCGQPSLCWPPAPHGREGEGLRVDGNPSLECVCGIPVILLLRREVAVKEVGWAFAVRVCVSVCPCLMAGNAPQTTPQYTIWARVGGVQDAA